MATVHLIHGYLGAGKTTFARRLERDLPAIRFTHDEWMATLFGRDPPADDFATRAAAVSALIEQNWTRCARLGLDVVLDLNFWTRADRDRARRLAAEAGATVMLYRLAVDAAAAWTRIEARNAGSEASLFIAPNTFETLKARVEPLDTDEERMEVMG